MNKVIVHFDDACMSEDFVHWLMYYGVNAFRFNDNYYIKDNLTVRAEYDTSEDKHLTHHVDIVKE